MLCMLLAIRDFRVLFNLVNQWKWMIGLFLAINDGVRGAVYLRFYWVIMVAILNNCYLYEVRSVLINT